MRIAPSFRGAKRNYFPRNDDRRKTHEKISYPCCLLPGKVSPVLRVGLFARLLFQHHPVTNTNPQAHTHTHSRARTHAGTTSALVLAYFYRISRDFSYRKFLFPVVSSCCPLLAATSANVHRTLHSQGLAPSQPHTTLTRAYFTFTSSAVQVSYAYSRKVAGTCFPAHRVHITGSEHSRWHWAIVRNLACDIRSPKFVKKHAIFTIKVRDDDQEHAAHVRSSPSYYTQQASTYTRCYAHCAHSHNEPQPPRICVHTTIGQFGFSANEREGTTLVVPLRQACQWSETDSNEQKRQGKPGPLRARGGKS